MDDLIIITEYQDSIVDLYQVEEYPEQIEQDPDQVEASPEQIEDDPEYISEDSISSNEVLDNGQSLHIYDMDSSSDYANSDTDQILYEYVEYQNHVQDTLDNINDTLDKLSFRNDDVVSINAVSDNSIINVPLTQYSISESLLLMILLSCLFAGMVYVIKRSLYKWS